MNHAPRNPVTVTHTSRRRFRFWFGRISFRARHALPPGFVVLENNLAALKAPPAPPSGYRPAANYETLEKSFRFAGCGWRRLSTARKFFFGWTGKTIGRGRN